MTIKSVILSGGSGTTNLGALLKAKLNQQG